MSQKMLLVFRASSPFLNAVHQSRVFDWNSFSWKSGKEVGNSHGRNWKSRPSQISKSWYQKSFVISQYQKISYQFIQNFSVQDGKVWDWRTNMKWDIFLMICFWDVLFWNFVQLCHTIWLLRRCSKAFPENGWLRYWPWLIFSILLMFWVWDGDFKYFVQLGFSVSNWQKVQLNTDLLKHGTWIHNVSS
jgi:hypothetical protein